MCVGDGKDCFSCEIYLRVDRVVSPLAWLSCYLDAGEWFILILVIVSYVICEVLLG
jgi:hypothetical protein